MFDWFRNEMAILVQKLIGDEVATEVWLLGRNCVNCDTSLYDLFREHLKTVHGLDDLPSESELTKND